MAVAIVVQRAAFLQRHTNHRLLGGGGGLGDGFRHFARLAMAEADPALAIANDDQRGEAEALAALHRLRNAVDVNQLLDQLFAAVFGAAATIVATTAIAVTAATAAVVAATSAARTTTATLTLGRTIGRRSVLLGFGFVSHAQNSNPPSRAASASALTRP